MMSCAHFWYGVVAGIVAALFLCAGGLYVVFRAFNDNNWEGLKQRVSRNQKWTPLPMDKDEDGGP